MALHAEHPRRWPTRAHTAFLNAVALVRTAVVTACADVDNAANPRAVLAAEITRLREQNCVLTETLRILGARIGVLPPQQRPHYPPQERAAILALAARGGWNHRQTANTFLVTAATIANWMRVVDDKGPDALVKPRKPINRLPAFVTAVVQQLSGLAPRVGKRQLATIVARAGIAISASTVGRMRKHATVKAPPPKPKRRAARPAKKKRVVTAKYPHHLWHVDITLVPTFAGFWVPWTPFSLPLRWPFCWHVVTVMDHFSRAVGRSAAFRKQPTAAEVCCVLDAAARRAKRRPRHIVSDQGAQFQGVYKEWCARNRVKPRYGAIGKHGSIAVLERFHRTIKDEALRVIMVPLALPRMQASLDAYVGWYNLHRPHTTLHGATPAEIRDRRLPATKRRGIETRVRYPLKARPGGVPRPKRLKGDLRVMVSHADGLPHLPIVRIRQAA
jgi:transposase InsO family protein